MWGELHHGSRRVGVRGFEQVFALVRTQLPQVVVLVRTGALTDRTVACAVEDDSSTTNAHMAMAMMGRIKMR